MDRWGERQTSMTMEQIIRIITTDNENEKFDLDIAAYTWKEIKRMKEAGHGGNADTYICAVRSLVKFVGREKVMLSEITAKFLQNWADWINKQPNVTRGYVTHNYLNRMRAIYNRAKKSSTMRMLELSEYLIPLFLTLISRNFRQRESEL